MSLVKTPADDSKTAAAEDHEVAAATKSGRPTAKDAALLAFVSSIGPFAANAYVPAFDEIGRYYGVGLVTVQQTLSIYLAAFACTSLLIGAASDAFGRKAVLALSMMVFAVSSLGLLFADSMEAFFIWRFVMGMAAAAGLLSLRLSFEIAGAGVMQQKSSHSSRLFLGWRRHWLRLSGVN